MPTLSWSEPRGSGRFATVRKRQNLLEAMRAPRCSEATLDGVFDVDWEITDAGPADVATTFDGVMRELVGGVLAGHVGGPGLSVEILPPSPQTWARAIDDESRPTPRLRAMLLAQRNEDVAPLPEDIVSALDDTLASLDTAPARLRRHVVSRVLAVSGPTIIEPLVTQGSTLLVQLWLASLVVGDDKQLADEAFDGVVRLTQVRGEAQVLGEAVRLLRQHGTLASVEPLYNLRRRPLLPESIRQAAKDAVEMLQDGLGPEGRGGLTVTSADAAQAGRLSTDESAGAVTLAPGADDE